MRIPKIVDAMNYIDDDLVSWAAEYKRVSMSARILHLRFLKVGVFFLVTVLIGGFIFFQDRGRNRVSSPFILTAYAASSEFGGITASVLKKDEKVPISKFETTNGLYGFVVSCNKSDDDIPSSITIISAGNYRDRIEEIVGIASDPAQNYYFYIPGENEVEPYTIPLFLTDTQANLICQYKVTITQIGGSYYAELVEESIMERIIKE